MAIDLELYFYHACYPIAYVMNLLKAENGLKASYRHTPANVLVCARTHTELKFMMTCSYVTLKNMGGDVSSVQANDDNSF
jgi:hypothetical protein